MTYKRWFSATYVTIDGVNPVLFWNLKELKRFRCSCFESRCSPPISPAKCTFTHLLSHWPANPHRPCAKSLNICRKNTIINFNTVLKFDNNIKYIYHFLFIGQIFPKFIFQSDALRGTFKEVNLKTNKIFYFHD